MWSKIIIGTAVVLIGSGILFYMNHTDLVSEEFPQARNMMENVETLSKDIARTQYEKKYAEMRKVFFASELERYTQKESDLTEELNSVIAETEKANQETAKLEAELNEKRTELSNAMKELESLVEIEDTSDPNDTDARMKAILNGVKALYQHNQNTTQENAQTQAQIDALIAQSAELNGEIDIEKKRAADRSARLAPPTLIASVINTQPNWNYVIIDAGTQQDVSIGSRLGVMRGDTKIAELNVTTVEANRAGADIILDTLMVGESVHIGDRVISIRPAK